MNNNRFVSKSYIRNVLLCFLFLCMTLCVYAKKNSGKTIRHRADSILITILGDRIFEQNIRYGGGSYSYTDWAGDKIFYETLFDNRRIYGRAQKFNIHYGFYLKNYPSFHEEIEVILDSALNIIHTSNVNFIPQFIKDGTTSTFISDKQVRDISDTAFTQKGIEEPIILLSYNKITKRYVWEISHLTNKWDIDNSTYEFIKIDAITSEIVDKGEYFTTITRCRMVNKY